LPPVLSVLYCPNNVLTTLPTLPTRLNILNCENNQLDALPTLPASLQILICNNNKLTTLPEFPPELRTLTCRGNSFDLITTRRIIAFYEAPPLNPFHTRQTEELAYWRSRLRDMTEGMYTTMLNPRPLPGREEELGTAQQQVTKNSDLMKQVRGFLGGKRCVKGGRKSRKSRKLRKSRKSRKFRK
jgi:hypothetical protein